MSNSDENKSSAKSNSKPNTGSSSNQRRSSTGNRARGRSASDGRRNNGGNTSRTFSPSMTATVASLVGAGVALGFGLFATRSRWMPYAEDLNDRLHDQWDNLTHRETDDDDDYDIGQSSDYRAKTDDLGKAANPVTTPGGSAKPGL